MLSPGNTMLQAVSDLPLLQHYRATEYHGVELLQRLFRKIDDPQLHLELTRQIADETRHALLWSERICELGGSLVPPRRVPQVPRRSQSERVTLQLDLFAQLHVAEERLQQQYRVHLSQSAQDHSTTAILQAILSDEAWHCDWVKQVLAAQQRKFGRTRVAATIDYFWSL